MRQIADAGEGVVVVLRNHDTARELAQRIQEKSDRRTASERDRRKELRTLGVGAQILADLGIRKMRVMSAPIELHGLTGFDLEVVDFVDND
jgi:3,4-dihydroxy 2-butanone 4-phosphate synthase/GTP cyclohydrolase II